MTTGLDWMTRLLLQQDREVRRRRYNPRPAGQVQVGSATDAVLHLMRRHPARRWRCAQLVAITGRSASAIDWALLYLRRQGRIEAEPLPVGSHGGQRWVYWLPQTQQEEARA